MKFYLVLFFSFCSLSSLGQGFASELKLGVDYFNDFPKNENDNFQKLESFEAILGLKLSTKLTENIDFGLSMDVHTLSNNFKLIERAYFYGTYVSYSFLDRDSRGNFGLCATLRAAKYRQLYSEPFFEGNPPWSLYAGFRIGGNYAPFNKLQNLSFYGGLHISFPAYRYSFWRNTIDDYANINYPYLGVAYTFGKQLQ